MTEDIGQDRLDRTGQDYFDQVEQSLRQAIRSGAHLPRAGRLRSLARAPRRRFQREARTTSAAGSWLRIGPIGFTLAGIAAVAIAAAVVFTAGLGAGTQRAFAGWSAHPTPPAGGQLQQAEALCRFSLNSNLRRITLGLERAARRFAREHGRRVPAAGHTYRGPWRTAAFDTRGPYTLLILRASRRREETCFTGRRRSTGIGMRRVSSAPLGPTRIGDVSGSETIVGPGPSWLDAEVGRVGSDVRGVTLELSGGREIVTTTRKGWFLAWWPNHEHPVAAKVHTTGGTDVQHPFWLGPRVHLSHH